MIRVIFLIVFGGIFIAGTIGFNSRPAGVVRKYNKTVTSEDGVEIYFDLFEPAGNRPGKNLKNKSAVILGHGIIVNKEMMKLMALELANAGFVAAALDFRGHGISKGNINAFADSFRLAHLLQGEDPVLAFSFDFLGRDIRAVKKYLKQRGDIDMSNLGYVGYSMGGGAGFAQLRHDDDFRAMVGVAPAPDFRNADRLHPRNLLIIHARYDEGIDYNSVLRVMENRTGVPADRVEPYRLYGSFTEGTAARLYIDPFTEHFLAPLDPDSIRETRDWMRRALQGKQARSGSGAHYLLWSMLLLQVVGAAGLFLTLLGPLLDRFGRAAVATVFAPDILAERGLLNIIRGAVIHILIFSFPAMVLASPLLLLPMVFSAFEVMLIFGPGVAVLLYVRRLAKDADGNPGVRDIYKRAFQTTSPANAGLGLGIGLILYLLLVLSVGRVFGLVPGTSKLPWTPVVFAAVAFSLLNIALFLQGVMQEKICAEDKSIKRMLGAGVLFYVLTVAVAAFIMAVSSMVMQIYFVLMFFIPTVFVMLPVAFMSTYIYAKTGDLVMVALVNAVFITALFCTMSPVLWGPKFLL